jgi:hypothetical protein
VLATDCPPELCYWVGRNCQGENVRIDRGEIVDDKDQGLDSILNLAVTFSYHSTITSRRASATSRVGKSLIGGAEALASSHKLGAPGRFLRPERSNAKLQL